MALAAAEGIRPDEFLLLTPRELRAVFKGSERRYRREAKLALFTAWQTVAFMPRPKKHKMPKLEPLLARLDEDEKIMSAQELRAQLIGWHRGIGGSVRIVPKGTIRRL